MTARLGRWDGSTDQQRIADADKLVGAPSGFTRHYLPFQGPWTGGFTQFSYANNRIPVFSAEPKNREQWADIAAGKYDGEILQAAKDLKAMPGRNVPAYITFNHEPENDTDTKGSVDLGPLGTQAEFVKAAEHFRSVIRTVLTATDAVYGVTLMAGSYKSGRWQGWLPPSYQFLGIDGYSHGNVKETFGSIFTPAHNAAVNAGKKLFIQESGVAEVSGEPSFKANWFADMRSMTKTWPELIGVEYSNVDAKEDYRIDTTTPSLTAFQALSTDPYFRGAWT